MGKTISKAIEAKALTKRYPPDVQALDGLDLEVEEGTIFALLGPNGAGKSTTVKILTTLTRPDSGEASVAGHDVLKKPDRVRRSIGVVGQKHGFDPEATGNENLVLQGAIYDLAGPELKSRVADLLERFNLTAAAQRPVKTYSGGMQRRLDIAMGLLHRPAALFLDEPTTGLDPEARVDMWEEIDRLASEEKMTILLTTHYLDEADELAAQVAIVDRGRIVANGTPERAEERSRGRRDPLRARRRRRELRARGARAGRRAHRDHGRRAVRPGARRATARPRCRPHSRRSRRRASPSPR